MPNCVLNIPVDLYTKIFDFFVSFVNKLIRLHISCFEILVVLVFLLSDKIESVSFNSGFISKLKK